jgi:hypothetical protein
LRKEEQKVESSNKSGLLTAGGILSIIGGVLEAIAGGIVVGIGIENIIGGTFRFTQYIPWFQGREIVVGILPPIIIILGIFILVLGAIGIAGGISALNRKSFGLSLAGAICVIPTVILGILAVIFVALGKRGFSGKT